MNDNKEEDDNSMWKDVGIVICSRQKGLLDVQATSIGRVVNLVLERCGAAASCYNTKWTCSSLCILLQRVSLSNHFNVVTVADLGLNCCVGDAVILNLDRTIGVAFVNVFITWAVCFP